MNGLVASFECFSRDICDCPLSGPHLEASEEQESERGKVVTWDGSENFYPTHTIPCLSFPRVSSEPPHLRKSLPGTGLQAPLLGEEETGDQKN